MTQCSTSPSFVGNGIYLIQQKQPTLLPLLPHCRTIGDTQPKPEPRAFLATAVTKPFKIVTKLFCAIIVIHSITEPAFECLPKYVTETWLSNDISNEQYAIPGYKLFRKDRDLRFFEGNLFKNKARGGVLAYVKEDLHPSEYDKLETNVELLWIKINPSINTELLVGVCYRPELAGVQYIERLCDSINGIDSQDVILLGDFNFRDIDWHTETAGSKSSDVFLNTMRDNF